jgi:uncharacterized SAM-binding protein YcdF (DUF218 family)
MTAWELTNTLASAVMPPGCLLVVTAIGMAALRRRRALGVSLIAASWLALYVLSMPIVAAALVRSLEAPYADPVALKTGEAIVVLGGGMYHRAPEYGTHDTVNTEVLARLRYSARLHRSLNKPVLVTGGTPRGEAVPEADVMKRVLEEEYGVPVRWAENASTTTDENAAFSSRLLRDAGVKTVYLVTHAWHMARARASFERAGLVVIPAPTLFHTSGPRTIVDFLPAAGALLSSSIYVHEVVGLGWYRLKFGVSSWSL